MYSSVTYVVRQAKEMCATSRDFERMSSKNAIARACVCRWQVFASPPVSLNVRPGFEEEQRKNGINLRFSELSDET